MEFFEKDLEEIIFNADKEKLRKKGLFIFGKLYRQLKIGNYGIADLIEVEKSYDEEIYLSQNKIFPFLKITIYELKKDTIGISAFLQAINYLKGIMRYFNEYYCDMDVKYRIKLIGKKIDNTGSLIYLPDIISNDNFGSLNYIEYYTYKYDIDGISFIQHDGYKLINEGF